MKKNYFSKILLSLSIIAGAVLFGTNPVNASASAKKIDSGSAGASITWALYDNGELKFTGSGEMYGYQKGEAYETTGDQGWYRYRNDVETIIIGEGITSIGAAAFCDFSEAEIQFPKSGLTSIGVASFANNTSLEEIVLPSSVKTIGAAAFMKCSSAKTITIKGSVNTINEKTFTNMTDAVITIASGCKVVKSEAFYGSAKRIEFPSSVTSIAADSLNKSKKWKLVKGGSDAVKKLANNNFIPYIDRNTSYTIPSKNITLTESSYKYTGEKIVPNITVKYTDYKYSTTLVQGKDYELYWSSDKSTNLGKHKVEVRGIGNFSFSKTLTYSIYADISASKVKLAYSSVPYDGKAKKPSVTVTYQGLELKEGSHYTVKYSNNKNEGTATVTVTGNSDNFASGSKKATFTIFKKKLFYYDESTYMVTNVTSTKREVMLADADIDTASYTVPETVTYDGETYDVVQIGQYAFKNCTILKKITIGNSVKKIGNGAFYGCSKLSKITLPKNLLTIGDKAFYQCKKLSSVSIPANVKSIGTAAFLDCESLQSVTIKTDLLTADTIGSSAFKNIHKKAIVYVNPGKVSAYKKILSKKGLNGASQKVVSINKK